MTFRFPAVVSVLLALSGAAGAQNPPPAPVRETAEAVLVEVPVRVMDRHGNPIRGLSSKDFELFDDGKKQEIGGFDAIDLAHKATSSDEPQALNPAGRRHFLLLFDLSFARPKAVLAARRAAKEFVLSALGDRDLAAIATFSVERGVRLLVTFSPDRVQLARAIDTLGISEPSSLGGDPLSFLYDVIAIEGGGTVRPDAADAGRRGVAQSAGIQDALETLASLERARMDQHARTQVVRLTQSLGGLAQALDTVQGRKDVIYLSEGFESRLLVGAKATDEEREWTLTGDMWKVDVEKTFGNTNLQTQMKMMGDLFRRTDCVIHAIDIAGLQSDVEAGFSPHRGESALFEIANVTGGELLRRDNDFGAQLKRLVARTNLVYVLAFRPTRSGEPDRFHELKVKVRAPAARVSARAGYFERKTFRALTPLERTLSAADVIANEIPVSDIPPRLLAAPVPRPDGLASVPVLIEIPGDRLLVGQTGSELAAEVYLYASNSRNELRDFLAQTVQVDLGLLRERLSKSSLKYLGELSLAPGDYRLRALVRNAETGRMGLAVQSLHVPDFSEKKPYLAPPVFLESSGDGIVVRGRLGARPAEAAGELLAASAGESLVAAAVPEVHSGSTSRVSVLAYHFATSASDSLKIGAQVLSEEGRPVRECAVSVVGKSRTDAEDRQTLLVAFTPEGLSPGRYALRVILQDAATGRGGHASTPFIVR